VSNHSAICSPVGGMILVCSRFCGPAATSLVFAAKRSGAGARNRLFVAVVPSVVRFFVHSCTSRVLGSATWLSLNNSFASSEPSSADSVAGPLRTGDSRMLATCCIRPSPLGFTTTVARSRLAPLAGRVNWNVRPWLSAGRQAWPGVPPAHIARPACVIP
jgi:hypothetical protein